MAFIVDEDSGDIILIQGDSGYITIEEINTDKNYKVYFSIYDKKRKIIGEEIMCQSNFESCIEIEIPKTLTDLLTVPKKQDSEEYYYGIKLCDEFGFEDTALINDCSIDDLNIITVYPKRTEGL